MKHNLDDCSCRYDFVGSGRQARAGSINDRDERMDASILKYLRTNGEQLDADISKALDVPMAQLQPLFARLSMAGELICCKVTRFNDGKKIEGTSYRLSCDLPAPTRGRKPGAVKKAAADTERMAGL